MVSAWVSADCMCACVPCGGLRVAGAHPLEAILVRWASRSAVFSLISSFHRADRSIGIVFPVVVFSSRI